MSYEGYSQFWCKKGHYWAVDCYLVSDDKKQKCPICDKKEIFRNNVDVTNGSFDDDGTRIDGFIEPEIKKRGVMRCKSCGREKTCKCSNYKIPKKKNGK